MEHVKINNTTYGFIKDFKHDHNIRACFNALTEATFEFNFENWYLNGYWKDNYIPYSLLHNNKVISNVSVNVMEFIIENEKKTGIQIGTVMTDKAYRQRGLSKFIMKHVINEWKEKADFIYLFANDSVLDFYPKFGFEIIDQYQHSKSVNTSNIRALKQLNMEDKTDVAFLIEAINKSIPISKISMRHNSSLVMFYCMSYKKNSIYYNEKFKAVVIADFENDTLYLHDVFSKVPVDLNDLIEVISGESINKVVLGFSPLDERNYQRSMLKTGDTLFVMKDKADYFKTNTWMFPVLSHA